MSACFLSGLLRRRVRLRSWLVASFIASLPASLSAAVPGLLHYQGRVVVNNVNFDGTGQFKFALVNTDGTTSYWSNDGTSTAGSQPAAAVSLTVTKGLYSVLLGDTALANMTAVPASVFHHTDVRLRVWFNDGVNGPLLLSPDQRIASAAYAMVAASVENVLLSDVVAPPSRPVVAWGRSHDGQITTPAGLADVSSVAAGGNHSLALLQNGTVVAWGENTAGQSTVPGTLSGAIAIAAGVSHSLAARSDGTVAAWGGNSSGQSTVPGTATTVTAVAAGENHSIALKSNGTVIAWGSNAFTQTDVPGALTSVIAIAAGHDHNLALKSDGTVVAWGRNEAQQTTVPGGLANVIAIAAGAFHSLALKADGTVVAWGWDAGGQSTVPAGLSGVKAISAGYSHSVALKNDGTVTAWGDNTYGQLEGVADLANIVSISAGDHHTLALRASLVPAQVARLDENNVFLGRIGIGRVPAVNQLEVEGQASKTTAGNWASNSDRRIKTDIQPVTGALEMIGRLNPVTFRYTPEYRAQHRIIEDVAYYNVIAQEFREVFPDAVRGSGDHLPDGSEILQVDTYPATITAIAAVKELKARLQAREGEIARLQQRMERIERLLDDRPAAGESR